MMDSFSLPPLAVVPVVVNAGAALLPAILAGLASVAALIFKPKELFAALRRRPQVLLFGVCGVVAFWLVWTLGAQVFSTGPATRQTTAQADGSTDWSKVALEILREESRGGAVVSQAPVVFRPASEPIIYRFNAERAGYAGGGSPRDLKPIWEYHVPDTMYLSSPLVRDGRVYGAACYLDPPGSLGTVFCLDAATGEVLWETSYKDPAGKEDFLGFFSSPALTADGKYLLIGQGLHADANAELICLDAQTGRVLWLAKTPLHIESSPAIEGDIVVVGAGSIEVGPDRKPKGDPEGIGNPGFVLGVRISDGETLWRFPLNDPEGSPAIRDGIAYIGSGLNGSAVAALRIAPDEELKAAGLERLVWRTPTAFPATGAVTLTGDLVLIGCGKGDFVFSDPNPEGKVMALDQKTGAVKWQTPLPDAVLGAIAVRDGKAIVPVRNGEVMALDTATGKILWRQENPVQRISGTSPILSGPAFTGEAIYAVSKDGYMAILDPDTGAVLEKHFINSAEKPGELGLCFSSPFVLDGRIFVGSETGGLRSYGGTLYP